MINLGGSMSQAAGDHYENQQSQIVSQGRDNEISNVSQQMAAPAVNVDLGALVDELASLRDALVREAKTATDYQVVGAVAEAGASAEQGDKQTLGERLKSAGQAALEMASRVGLPVAELAIKQALGLTS